LNVEEFHQSVIKTQKPKDFAHTWFGPQLVTCAIDPEAAKFILIPKMDKPILKVMAPFPPSVRELFANGIVWVNGDEWKLHKALTASAFTESAHITYFPKMLEVVEKALMKFEEERVFKGDIDMSVWSSRLTLDVLGSTVFGKDFGMLDDKIHDYYESYRDIINKRHPLIDLFPFMDFIELYPTAKHLHNSISHIKQFIKQIIKDKKENPNSNQSDITSYILKGENLEVGQLTEDEIIADLFIYIVAGHETTAMTLSWLLYELVLNPQIQEKIYEEVVQKLGKEGMPTFEDIKIPYLECVLSENMRLHPAAPMFPTRKATQDFQYNGLTIPKESLLAVNYHSLHRNEEYWENPEQFDPDRFLPENKKNHHRFAFIPFAAGPRQCIGMEFSLIQQKLFTIRLLQKYRVVAPKTKPLTSLENRPLMNTSLNLCISLHPRVNK